MRFRRQVHEHNVNMDAQPLSLESAEALENRFRREYEQVVGKGSAYTEAEVELVTLCVEIRIPLNRHAGPISIDTPTGEVTARAAGRRRGWFDGRWFDCDVFDGNNLTARSTVHGPAFVELPTTTVVVYPDQWLYIDAQGNMALKLG
jgi:N-methylhydantoinase A